MDDGWLVDMVLQFMRSRSWNEPLSSFINENCVKFDNFQDENKHEFVEVHNEYKMLIDNLLAAHLLEVDISPEDFEKRCIEAGLVDDPRLAQILSHLIAAEDFLTFKQLMVEHHTNMQHEAEEIIKSAAEDAAVRDADAGAPATSSRSTSTTAHPQTVPGPPSAEAERAFGAAGGSYGRATLPASKKSAGNEKASAIRLALTSALRPK